MGFEKALRAVKVIKDQIQYRSQSLLNLARGYFGGKWPLRLQLHGEIYRPDSFVLMLRYCANLKAIRYESTTLNRIVANKSHRVIVA